MEEWKKYKMSDFIDFNPTVSLKKGTVARKITMDKLIPHSRDIYDWEYEPYSGGSKFQNGDTIMARITPCLENGKHAFISLLNDGETAYGSTEYIVMRGIPGISDNRFVYYLSHFPDFKNAAVKSMVGSSGRQRAQVDVLKNLEFYLPGLKEQRKIADTLSTLDDKIALNNRINHNLEEQARIQFEAWCAKCVEFKLIRELSSNILDYTPNNHKKVILLNSSDVTEGRFESLPFVDNQNLKGQFKKRFMKGDILYSEIRPRNHHFAICYFDADEYIASTRLMVIRKNEKEISSDALLYQYLLMPSVLEEFTSKTESRSGTFPQGNYDDLSSSEVPYSSDNLQIGKALDAIYGVIWANMEENKRLASIRDSLLPQLMSGLITC